MQSPACRRGDLPKIVGYYYPPVSGLHPSISGRVGTVTYVKIGCKFETVASKLEAEASICSIKIEQVTRHITVPVILMVMGRWSLDKGSSPTDHSTSPTRSGVTLSLIHI